MNVACWKDPTNFNITMNIFHISVWQENTNESELLPSHKYQSWGCKCQHFQHIVRVKVLPYNLSVTDWCVTSWICWTQMRWLSDHLRQPIYCALQMPGQVGSLKPRKRKSSSEVKGTRKVCVHHVGPLSTFQLSTMQGTHIGLAGMPCVITSVRWLISCHQASATRRRCMKSPKMHSAAESSAAGGGYSKADGPLERLSHISCECQQSAGRRRCSASPELEGPEGKENELRTGLDLDGCRGNSTADKQEPEDMDCEEPGKSIFPDDDSNQILPVEQFFGNLDAVQVRHFGSSPWQGLWEYEVCSTGNIF